MTDSSPTDRTALPGFALSLGMLWLAAGALYKLFDGVPADLPPTVVDLSQRFTGLDAWDTFRYAIAVELAVVGLVISVPRLGWLPLCGAFATFLAVLTPLALEGAESCGCFGGTISIKPTTMIAIDGGLLLLILFSKPWRMRGAGLGLAAALPLVAVGIYGPIAKLERPVSVAPTGQRVAAPAGGASAVDASDPAEPGAIPGGAGEGPSVAQGAPEGAPADPAAPAETAPAGGDEVVVEEVAGPQLPVFMQLDFAAMEGQSLYDQPFYAIADMSQGFLDVNSHAVVFRRTCEVCAEHLKELDAQVQRGEFPADKMLVLVRIDESVDDRPGSNVCTVLPQGAQMVTLPRLERDYLVTTPVSFDVDESGVIRNVVDVREELGH